MPCYHPLKAYAATNPETGKKKLVFVDEYPAWDYVIRHGIRFDERVPVPCGQCLGCRLEYSRQWAVRCVLESMQWEHNYFLTLTYDPEHVPIRDHVRFDESSGEVLDYHQVMTLWPDDLKAFLKRLREHWRVNFEHTNIRFFACGEYGPANSRPHYHIILFNCPIPDLELDHYDDGYAYYRSPIIEKKWGKGFCLITDFSYETAAYVARYMLKKHKGKDKDYYDKNGIVPEFTRSSRRPGLAFDYYDKHKDKIYSFDKISIVNGDGKPLNVRPPKYFDRLFDIENPEQLQYNKDKRKAFAQRSNAKLRFTTDKSDDDYLVVQEQNKALSISSLRRVV